MGAVKRAFAWSFSALDVFEVCRKKYYHLKVKKDVKDEDSTASQDGRFIHAAMFKRVIDGVPLPIKLRQHEKLAKRFADAKGEKHGEMQLALNKKMEPRDWFAKDVWVRAILDLLIVRGTTAVLVDWKTGKRKERYDQLRLAAAVLSRYMPEIETFTLVFVWLKDGEVSDPVIITKAEMRGVWTEFLPRVKEITDAIKTTTFPATESPLCGWCPVTSCPNWFDRSER